MTATTQRTPVRRPLRVIGLDGFRGGLAICIIVAHVGSHWAPGALRGTGLEVTAQAVVSFFVLSGFLIYWPFARAVVAGTSMRGKLGDYALSRVLRVFPGATVGFVVAWLSGTLYLTNAYDAVRDGAGDSAIGRFEDPWRVLLHLSLQQSYLPSQIQTGIAPAWTLTIELAYYLLLPPLVAVCVLVLGRVAPRLGRYAVAAAPGAVLVAVGLVSKTAGTLWQQASGLEYGSSEWGPNALAVFSRSLPVWADGFGWGMVAIVVWIAVEREAVGPRGLRTARRSGWIAIAVGLVAVVAAYLLVPRFISAGVAIASLGVILLLALPVKDGHSVWRVSHLVDNPVLLWLGKTSLSIYLLHMPVILFLDRAGVDFPDTPIGLVTGAAVVLATTVALASVVFLGVERPALRLRKLGRRRPA
ncbi:acyltransferase [Rathayibacter sp. VKM Ac-2929]|uniref:acyltransferase family protein n=1 Tax=Rathayibacter sp. VKM Ac-2929 TaxID=2929480 RepID=UPI001FB37B42|nr:acyltransferase [Rathayibacter sp. VKM Ac-2929]MCJ1673765.1 acyltransferase [Rathayibacter sp. VKM Ac-2929]